jgi:redox-sensitive bicupin YhaK (pirin superfamily)
MITHRSYKTRGNPRADWINSYRTFSFPGYFNPEYMNFGDLQTINDDRVQPGGHVPPHEHKNMEIFGYVVEGVCRHTDNQGNVMDVPAGAVQRMSAGRGIMHTEGNASETPNRYLQLWISPNVTETEPIHEWYQFTRKDKLGRFCDITEKLPIKQDAKFLAGIFNEEFDFQIETNRKYYLYVISGESIINGISVTEGDGISFENESLIVIKPDNESEIILFDLK